MQGGTHRWNLLVRTAVTHLHWDVAALALLLALVQPPLSDLELAAGALAAMGRDAPGLAGPLERCWPPALVAPALAHATLPRAAARLCPPAVENVALATVHGGDWLAGGSKDLEQHGRFAQGDSVTAALLAVAPAAGIIMEGVLDRLSEEGERFNPVLLVSLPRLILHTAQSALAGGGLSDRTPDTQSHNASDGGSELNLAWRIPSAAAAMFLRASILLLSLLETLCNDNLGPGQRGLTKEDRRAAQASTVLLLEAAVLLIPRLLSTHGDGSLGVERPPAEVSNPKPSSVNSPSSGIRSGIGSDSGNSDGRNCGGNGGDNGSSGGTLRLAPEQAAHVCGVLKWLVDLTCSAASDGRTPERSGAASAMHTGYRGPPLSALRRIWEQAIVHTGGLPGGTVAVAVASAARTIALKVPVAIVAALEFLLRSCTALNGESDRRNAVRSLRTLVPLLQVLVTGLSASWDALGPPECGEDIP